MLSCTHLQRLHGDAQERKCVKLVDAIGLVGTSEAQNLLQHLVDHDLVRSPAIKPRCETLESRLPLPLSPSASAEE